MSRISAFTALTFCILALSGCIADPRLNAGLSVGGDGVTMTPSVQATVGGGLLQYTPKL